MASQLFKVTFRAEENKMFCLFSDETLLCFWMGRGRQSVKSTTQHDAVNNKTELYSLTIANSCLADVVLWQLSPICFFPPLFYLSLPAEIYLNATLTLCFELFFVFISSFVSHGCGWRHNVMWREAVKSYVLPQSRQVLFTNKCQLFLSILGFLFFFWLAVNAGCHCGGLSWELCL